MGVKCPIYGRQLTFSYIVRKWSKIKNGGIKHNCVTYRDACVTILDELS